MTQHMFGDRRSRVTIFLAALAGAAGIGLAAAASHGGDARLLGNASTICLAHAPVLLALGLFGLRSRRLVVTAALLALGTALFAADLVMRHFTGHSLFAGAAPIGGGAMILGWLSLAVAVLLP